MSLIENRLTKSKNARYWAVGLYILGSISIAVGYLMPQSWSYLIMQLGLVLWVFPVCWCAYKYSKEGW